MWIKSLSTLYFKFQENKELAHFVQPGLPGISKGTWHAADIQLRLGDRLLGCVVIISVFVCFPQQSVISWRTSTVCSSVCMKKRTHSTKFIK